MNKQIREVLNDGFANYGVQKTERSANRVRVNGKFENMGRLAFKTLSCREQDYQIAQTLSAVLDMKIKTFYPPDLKDFPKNKLKIRINNIEYDVIKVDHDTEKRYLFFYLQEVGNIDDTGQDDVENAESNQ